MEFYMIQLLYFLIIFCLLTVTRKHCTAKLSGTFFGLFFWVGKEMYVDAEFCQRKLADIQLYRHNKGLREEFALDVCADTNHEPRPV